MLMIQLLDWRNISPPSTPTSRCFNVRSQRWKIRKKKHNTSSSSSSSSLLVFDFVLFTHFRLLQRWTKWLMRWWHCGRLTFPPRCLH
jgi:hypothetical protein